MTVITKNGGGYGQIVKNGVEMVQDDRRRAQQWRTGDTGERAVCFRKQVQRSGELNANFD